MYLCIWYTCMFVCTYVYVCDTCCGMTGRVEGPLLCFISPKGRACDQQQQQQQQPALCVMKMDGWAPSLPGGYMPRDHIHSMAAGTDGRVMGGAKSPRRGIRHAER